MVNNEAAAVLVEYSKQIAHFAGIAEVEEEQETVVTRAAHNHAWRLLSHLITFAEATKESDMYWTLLDVAIRNNKSDKECARLRAIAKSEDRNYLNAKAALEKLLQEIQAVEKADPKGKKRQAELEERQRQVAEAKAKAEAEKLAAAEAKKAAKKAAAAAAKPPAKKTPAAKKAAKK